MHITNETENRHLILGDGKLWVKLNDSPVIKPMMKYEMINFSPREYTAEKKYIEQELPRVVYIKRDKKMESYKLN